MRTLPERLRAVYTSYTEDALATDEAAELFEKLDALHQPAYAALPDGKTFWCTCGKHDCPTAALLHPAPNPVPELAATPANSCGHCGAWLPTGTMRCNHCGRRT